MNDQPPGQDLQIGGGHMHGDLIQHGGFAGHGGPMWLHDVFMLAVLIVIIAGVILLVRMLKRPGGIQAEGNWTAVHELDVRYARGEVDRDEYLRRRSDLLDPKVHLQPLNAPSEGRPKK